MLLFSGATIPAEVFPAPVRAIIKWMPLGVGELKFKTMPGLKVASIFHKGSYGTLMSSYETLFKYIEENGYKISDSIRESYIDGVWNKENESEWLTEIQVPVI